MTSTNGTLCLLSSTLQRESTSSKPQHVLLEKKRNTRGKREGVRVRESEGAENRYRRSIRKSPLSFISSVIIDCDKLAPSYLKPGIGQMVGPAGRGGNEMGFTMELILGVAILPTTN